MRPAPEALWACVDSDLREVMGLTDQGASVLRRIKDRADEMADVWVKLIAVDTENPPGRRFRRCAEFLHHEVERLGLASENLPVPPTESLESPCIVCATVGNGSKLVYFHGHFDVVPAQDRTQFTAERRDGKMAQSFSV